VGQSQKSFMWNMVTDPLYIPAKFGDDTFKPEKVVHEKPDKKFTGRIRIRRKRIINRLMNSYKNKRTSTYVWMS
jgi:hypothetical protein